MEVQRDSLLNISLSELRQKLHLQCTALEIAAHGIAIVDASGTILWVNPAFTTMTGFSAQEAVGQSFRILKSGKQSQEYYRNLWETILSGRVWTGELVNRKKDGSLYVELETITPVQETAGNVTQYVVIMEDVTERKHIEQEIEAVLAVTDALRSAGERKLMAPALLEHAQKLMEASGTAVAFLDPANNTITFEPRRGRLKKWKAASLPIERGITGQILRERSAVTSTTCGSTPGGEPNRPDPVEQEALDESWACVPLIAQNQVIGALWITRTPPFSEYDLRVLTAIADIAAAAMHRAQLQEQTELRLQRMAALQAIDQAISSSLDLSVTLGVLLDQVIWQLDVDAADVLLLNPRKGTLEYAATRGFNALVRMPIRQKIEGSVAGQAVVTRQTIQIADLEANRDQFTRSGIFKGEGFCSYIAIPLIAKEEVKGVLELFYRRSRSADGEWLGFLEALANQAAIAIDNALLFEDLQRSNAQIAQAYDSTLAGWVRTLGLRDGDTEGHTRRVTELTIRLAEAIEIAGSEMESIRRGALLHDIGKMGIPDNVLRKRGPLTEAERQVIRMHPVYAYELLSPIPYLKAALDIPYCHHEHWDGSGYPRGLKGEEIPLAARLFTVADVWDALRSNRPYRDSWDPEKALRYIRKQAGRLFDPRVVEVFLRVVRE